MGLVDKLIGISAVSIAGFFVYHSMNENVVNVDEKSSEQKQIDIYLDNEDRVRKDVKSMEEQMKKEEDTFSAYDLKKDTFPYR